jgi:hypothetical protein
MTYSCAIRRSGARRGVLRMCARFIESLITFKSSVVYVQHVLLSVSLCWQAQVFNACAVAYSRSRPFCCQIRLYGMLCLQPTWACLIMYTRDAASPWSMHARRTASPWSMYARHTASPWSMHARRTASLPLLLPTALGQRLTDPAPTAYVHLQYMTFFYSRKCGSRDSHRNGACEICTCT